MWLHASNMQDIPQGTPDKDIPTFEILDTKELYNDVKKYGSCGVPQEKLSFWNKLEDVFEELKMEASDCTSELCLLWTLLSKDKCIPAAVERICFSTSSGGRCAAQRQSTTSRGKHINNIMYL